jgi:hypothetical protein
MFSEGLLGGVCGTLCGAGRAVWVGGGGGGFLWGGGGGRERLGDAIGDQGFGGVEIGKDAAR